MSDQRNCRFGKMLREKRKAKGMSLRELAHALEISSPYLSDVELGRRNPFDGDLLLKLPIILGCDSDELTAEAMISRGSFILSTIDVSVKHLAVGATLSLLWRELTYSELHQIHTILKGHKNKCQAV